MLVPAELIKTRSLKRKPFIMNQDTLGELIALEESLWRAETRFDDAAMNKVFADDLREFDQSGRRYQRKELFLGDGDTTEFEATFPFRDCQVRTVSADIAQIMYVSEVRYGSISETSNRSSIWRREKDGWKLCFHQGTLINGHQA